MKIYSNCEIGNEVRELDVDSGVEMVVILKGDCPIERREFDNIMQAIYRRRDIRLVVIGEAEKKIKSLINAMLEIGNTRIYITDKAEAIDDEYISKISNRVPSVEEVKQFLTAEYSINNVRNIIDEIINSNNKDDAISKYKDVLHKIVDICEKDKVNESQTLIDIINDKIEAKSEEIKELNATINRLNEENNEIKNFADGSPESSNDNSNDDYVTIQTRSIDLRVSNIVYFKELSYVTGVNTLIKVIEQIMENEESKYKVIIVDNNHERVGMYTDILKTSEIETYKNRDDMVLEANEVVIDNMRIEYVNKILSSNRQFDYVFIYDKCMKENDIVKGINVNRVFVVNSDSELSSYKSKYGIKDTDIKIMSEFSDYEDNFTVKIAKIKDFNTDEALSSKLFKYRKIIDSKNGKPILFTILGRQ